MNEVKDSLQSRALLSILDLIGEGEIEGLVSGERSIFFNETPLRNADGTYNFNGVTTAGTYGTNTQSPLTGFGNSVETPYNIGVRLNALTPYTFSVTNSAADLARVIINIPALSKTNPENGDIDGTTVQYKFQLSTNGGAFQDVEVDAAYVDNVTWAQVGGYWQVTAAAGSSKLIASITATSTGNGVGQIVVQPQEFNGSTWVNLGETKTVDVIGAWESTYSEAPSFKTRASLSMPVESVYNTIRFVPVSTRLDSGTSIQLAQGNASYWKRSATVAVSGKTRSKYQRSHILRLPTPRSSAQIRVTRVTADAADSLTVNETWIESFTEITSLNINYPNSALVGVRIDAQQFNSIPSRAYLVDGLKIQVPSNYNPVTRTYTGIWNGTFQTAYSNNPAWVLYDILTNNRYGLGNYITSTQVDKAALYTIGKYCDEIVPDGFGGSEPRFTINTVIQSAADAYKVITDITSAFRGMAFWDGGVVGLTQDAPADPSMLYTNANVVDGMFTYTGSSRRDRHSVAHVTWNDPSDNYKRKIEYVEDQELIQRFGIRRVDTLAFGCTSRGQAARVGRWILYTERYESDVIQFKVGLDAAFMSPGEIIKIHDRDKSGKRFGGRLVAFTNTTATLDSPVTLTTGTATISLMLPDGTFAERTLNQTPGTHTDVSWTTPLAQLPVADAVWMLSQASLEPTLARVIGISQSENNTFEIAAIEHNPSKFGAIEQGLTLQTRTTSIIDARFVDTPESLRVVERSVLNAIGQPEVKLSISWYSNATTHEVAYRNISEDRGGNWTTVTVTNETFFELTDPSKGEYEIAITAINPLGRRSKTARINFVVAGKLVNNDLPTALTIRPLFSGIALTWTNAGNKDFAGVEIWRSTTNVLLSAIRLDTVTTSTYSDMSVDFEDGEHFYWIRAFDTYGNYTGYVGPVNGVALNLPDNTSDTSTPPAPTGLTATAGLATIMLEWASPAYTNHKTTEVWASVSNAVASATLVGSTDTTMFAHALGITGATRYYWIRFKSKADIVGPYNAVAGVTATTGKIGNTDLGPLVVQAENLANNAVTVDKILAGAVSGAKFASGIEPVTVVTGSTVPTTKSTNTIFLTGTGKLYRWDGTAYIATVPTSDLSGTVADAQIAGLAASKVTGQLTNSQIADVAAAKMTGQLVSTQIADAAITTAKFASGIQPVEIVSTLPTTGNFAGRVAFLTTDNKLYRHTGSAWVSSVASADISGTIADAQIAALAASKVTGQLSNSQIADLAAAKLTGTISASQIADGSVSGTKFASGIEPVTVVSSVPGTKSTNAIFNTADGKLYRWNGSAYVATVPAADLSGTVSDAQIAGLAASKISGQVIASQIADAAVTTAKFAAGIEPVTVVTSVPGTKSTNSIFNTADGKVYRWNGTAYVTTVSAADISGTLAAAQIASVAASQITGQLSDTQLAAIGAAKVTGQIVGTQITDGAISTAKLAAGSVTAATIAADTITASQIAANAITSAELAAGAVVAGKIAAGSIQAGDIAAGTITGDKLAANTITASQIAADTITAGQIAAGAISASELAAGAVTAGKIAAGAVTANEIAANAITAGKIDAAAVTTAKIAAGAVTATEIATGAITAGKIAAGAVTATEIAADTITAAQIAAGAISASELAAGAVTAGKIAANAVTATEIAAGSITTAKIAATAVTANEIAANAITATKIDAGAVTTAKLAAGAVTANEIAATTITGAKIAAGTITGTNIAADTITAGQIAAGAIGASEIAANAVTTSKLLVSGIGSAINDDPNTQDVSAWTGGSFGLFNDATSPTGSALSLSSLSATTFSAKTFPLDAAKNYTLRIKARVSGGSTVPATLTVAFYNTSGTLLTGTAYPTGWPNVGTYHYFGLVNQVPPSSWTEYSISFGPDEVAKIPSGAAGLRIGFERGSAGVPGSHLYTSIRLMEKAAADLIVNGAISAAKLTLSDLTNIADNGDFEAGRVGWSDTSYISNDSTNAYSGNWVLAMPGGGAAYAVRNSLAIPVSPGEDYYADAFIKGTGTATGYVRIRGLNSANSEIWTQASTAVTGAYQQVSTTGTVPANVVRINVEIVANAGSGTVYADRVRMLRRSNASLIVDGAITASKIATDAVTANSIAANAVTAAKIEAGAVTAAKIAAGSIDASKIAAGTITANEIAGSTITGAKIAAGTITASNIATDTITAGQIAAGAITASEVASNAITTAKLFVSGAGSAINDDPNTQDASAWTGGTIAIVSDTTSPTTSALQITSTGSTTLSARSFPLDAAKNYNLRIKAKQVSGTSTAYLLIAFFDSSGAVLSGTANPTGWPGVGTYHYFGRVNQTIPGAWTEYSISFGPDEVAKIPASAVRAQVGFLGNYTGSGEQRFTSVRLMEKAAADLIVDGAITADKIAVNAVTAGKIAANAIAVGTAAIQNGAIVNAMIGNAAIDDAKIANATITSAKIASLSVDKLTAGNLAVNQYIRSNSFVTGSSGWTINADGTAEFGAASIRGQLTASQINSNGLTIKDNAGNILFGVGNPLDFSNVGGATKPAANATKNTISQGTLAARPTGSDGDFYYATDNFTLYQKISGAWVASSNQTYVDGSGQMQGVSSGAGTAVANNQISISGGAIQGIGTGAGTAVSNSSITISGGAIQGIGTGAGTAVANNQITIASGAIQGIGTGAGTAVANSSVTLSSTGALQNAGGGQMTTLIASDTRNDNQTPSWYAAGLTEEFKNRSAIGAPGSATYGILRTEKPWTDASGGVVTQTFKSEEGEWKRTSTPGSYATWTSWAPKADRQLSSSNISTFVANDAIGISQIGTTLQTTNFSSTAGWQINKSGTATFNDVALRGAVNSGSYTGYAWPASGTGFHLGPNGLLLGNYNVVLGNGKRRYFQVEASGNVYSPGFNIVDGDAVFSGTVSANVINTDAIVGGAASTGVSTTSTGASASVVVVVPVGASAVFIEYYLGPPTVTATGGGGKNDPGGFTYGPILTGLTANGAAVASVIIGPTAGTYTVTCTRSYYTGTMRLSILVLKR